MSSSETSPCGAAISADSSATASSASSFSSSSARLKNFCSSANRFSSSTTGVSGGDGDFALAGAAHLVLEEVAELLVGDELGVDGRERLRRRELLDGGGGPDPLPRTRWRRRRTGAGPSSPGGAAGCPTSNSSNSASRREGAGGDDGAADRRLGLRAREAGAREDAPPVLEACRRPGTTPRAPPLRGRARGCASRPGARPDARGP